MRNFVTFGGKFVTLRATGAENLEAEIRDICEAATKDAKKLASAMRSRAPTIELVGLFSRPLPPLTEAVAGGTGVTGAGAIRIGVHPGVHGIGLQAATSSMLALEE